MRDGSAVTERRPHAVKRVLVVGPTRSDGGMIVEADDRGLRIWFRSRRARAKTSAEEAVDLSVQRYRAGTMTLVDLLDRRCLQIAAEQRLSEGEAGLTTDFVTIQKAIGPGWSA